MSNQVIDCEVTDASNEPPALYVHDPLLEGDLSIHNDGSNCEAVDGFDPCFQVGESPADFQDSWDDESDCFEGFDDDTADTEALPRTCLDGDAPWAEPEVMIAPSSVESSASPTSPAEETGIHCAGPPAVIEQPDVVTDEVNAGDVPDSLSESDQIQLDRYSQRCDLLEDRVLSVAKGYQTGLLLRGRPGTGKSHLVKKVLDELQIPYIYRSGHMSAMGLFDLLGLHPDSIIVIDDIPLVMQDRRAQQILLPALDGESGKPRTITSSARNRGDRPEAIQFAGGIIAISNTQLRRDPLADALGSRTTKLDFDPSDAEIEAVIRDMARNGYEDVTPAECQEVAEFIFGECGAHEYRIDLRCWFKGLQDYRQHRDGHANSHWKDLIRSNMRQVVVAEVVQVPTRLEKHLADLEKVRAAMAKHPDDWKRQCKESGFKKSKLFELRREVESQS